MRTLSFKVTGQALSKDAECDFSGIQARSSGYLVASFSFDNDWDELRKAAEFHKSRNDDKAYAVLLGDDNTCFVPDEVTDGKSFYIHVVGRNDKTRIETNKVRVRQEV